MSPTNICPSTTITTSSIPHHLFPRLPFLLLLSIPAVYFLAPRLLLPKTLPAIPDADETEDLALFRRAVLLSAAPSAPGASASSAPGASASSEGVFGRRPQPRPKVAFLFLTNSDLVFAPLWEKFFAGHHGLLNVYVHADPAANLTLPPTPSFRGRIIRGKATARASATLISAARRLLRKLNRRCNEASPELQWSIAGPPEA